MWHQRKLPHNLVSVFQMENVSPGKNEKNVEYLRHHSSDFHQVSPKWSHCVWISNSFNRWPWKCRSRWKFCKNAYFWHANISKKILSTSNLADGNRFSKIAKASECGSIWTNNHWRCFNKFCSIFHLFQVERKTKCYGSLILLHIFKNILQIIDRVVLENCKKMYEAIGNCRIT